jgi:hypothetical protein
METAQRMYDGFSVYHYPNNADPEEGRQEAGGDLAPPYYNYQRADHASPNTAHFLSESLNRNIL